MAQSLIVVSSYPRKGATHAAETVGVASYTKLLLQSLAVKFNGKIIVLSERFSVPEKYFEDGLFIKRFWKRNNFLSIFRLFVFLLQRREKQIIFSFEINMFGNLFCTLLAMLGLFFLFICGKSVVFILHQAPQDMSDVETNKFYIFIKNIALKLWYFYLNIVVKKIVVFEKYLLNSLGKKAIFIPHLISSTGSPISKLVARENLNLDQIKKYAMVFGYIAPYKGIKWLLENWTKDLGYELIVVGGINPNHKSNKLINDYVNEIYSLANKKNINVTGFVTEEQMISYFIACDLIILPYMTMFSSSGPLAMAWSYEKPAILSEKLKYYLDSEDINLALQKSGLKDGNLIFELNKEDLSRIIRQLDEDRLTSLKLFAKEIKARRKIEEISSQYLSLINKIYS